MTNIRLVSTISLIAALALACNSKPSPSAPAPAKGQAASAPAEQPAADKRVPAKLTVHAKLVRGTLQAKTQSGPWRPVAAGDSMSDVSAVRALGKGAYLELQDAMGAARPSLWLRGGSSATLWHTDDDGILVQMDKGQARLRASERPTYFASARGPVAVTGNDIVAYKRDTRAQVVFAHTRRAGQRAAWTVDLHGEVQPAGLGTIEVEQADTDQTAFLQLRRVRVDVERAGDHAFTSVEHIFYNPTDAQLEGTFRFPLPDGAMPLGLAMEINGRLMEGEIVERAKARKTYESIVDEMQDPALLEWQQGNRFKLRVFPIEANSEKRVILRYAAPLTETIDGLEYVYPTAAPEMQKQLDRFSLTFDGRSILDRERFTAGEDVIVPVAADDVSSFMQHRIAAPAGELTDANAAAQARTAGDYLALRLSPDWSQLMPGHAENAAAPAAKPTTLLAIVDTSRSALESRELLLSTLQMALGELGAGDRFMIMTSDIGAQLHSEQPVAVADDAIRTALERVRAIEPDGASDLGAAFALAADVVAKQRAQGAAPVEILYLGDGTPTWGTTDPAQLKSQLDSKLAGVPVHAAILGKGASLKQWREITAGRAGRTARPRTLEQARRFAFVVARSAQTPRLENVRLTGLGDAIAFPRLPQTLYRGDALVAIMRSATGQSPSSVQLEGTYAGQPFKQTVQIVSPAATSLIAQRWATHQIDELQTQKAEKELIVELSRDFGVMSKHTSLLVLESEEAYRQHGIERRRALAQNAAGRPQVTGGDLESLGAREASLSPDHIQPGDPEIRIPAPRDARSVVVVFPFGETKLAHFDANADAWIARFLIDKETPDGKYLVLINITHADGRIESLRLPYFVDTSAPQVEVTFQPRAKGFTVKAKQIVTQAEMVSMGVAGEVVPTGKQAKILSDATRVELWLPSGDMLSIYRKNPGQFRRYWRLGGKPTEPMVVRVVVTDDAHNQSIFALRVHPDGRTEQLDDAALVTPASDSDSASAVVTPAE